ncbi:DUF2127 domain-containing protein [Candidatus Kaiserbacteria bacterium]|nr:DUF2127 domain-containing protein [Candidatus Kaiserbacteria bacterium]
MNTATDILPLPNPPAGSQKEKGIYEVFYISVLLKGLNAAVEIVLGGLLFFTARHGDVLVTLVRNELIDDPNDFLARHAESLVHYLDPQVQLFAALYLLSHGIVKGVLVWGLLKNKTWSYPAALAVFSLFILYQIVKWFQHHSLILVFLTVFDAVVMWLIWHEYRMRVRTGTLGV